MSASVPRRRGRLHLLVPLTVVAVLAPLATAALDGTAAAARPLTIEAKVEALLANNGQFVLQPGAFDAYVGDSSAAVLHGRFTVTS